MFGNKELIYRDPAISCFTRSRCGRGRGRRSCPTRPTRACPTPSCSVQNVAKGRRAIDPKQVRYLRIAQRIAWPYDNTYGGQRYEPDVKSVMINWNPVRVLGDVPVEADGSAHFRVPADTPRLFPASRREPHGAAADAVVHQLPAGRGPRLRGLPRDPRGGRRRGRRLGSRWAASPRSPCRRRGAIGRQLPARRAAGPRPALRRAATAG